MVKKMQLASYNPSIIGGILLVIGNVVGAGILALPIATAQLGLFHAIITLSFFWLLMMLGAYYFLEANLALPDGSNLISMARYSLGFPGVLCAWVCNLIVMYSLIAAYLSGGGDLIQVNLQRVGVSIPSWGSALLFLMVFGYIVSRGIRVTDYTNRLLMTLKFSFFIVMMIGLVTHFNPGVMSLSVPSRHFSGSLLITALTSYGFAVLVPSLRSYYHSDVSKLRKIIFYGTSIPFICYLAWITVVFAVIPYAGTDGLQNIAASSHPLSDLQRALSDSLHIQWLVQAMNLFSAICILTSFLANSISLIDFIADGCNLHNNGNKKILVYVMAYLPALLAVLFFPKAFLLGLSVAGLMAIVQLLLLPGFMLWFLRYVRKDQSMTYQVMGGKGLLVSFLLVSTLLLILSI